MFLKENNQKKDVLTQFNISSRRIDMTTYAWSSSGLITAVNQYLPRSSDTIGYLKVTRPRPEYAVQERLKLGLGVLRISITDDGPSWCAFFFDSWDKGRQAFTSTACEGRNKRENRLQLERKKNCSDRQFRKPFALLPPLKKLMVENKATDIK